MKCRACAVDHSPLIRCEQAAAINRTAINADAINKSGQTLGRDEAIKGSGAGENSAAIQESDANDVVATALGKTANRRAREAYNAYMREYMRRRRAG